MFKVCVKFSGRLRNIPGVDNYLVALSNFQGTWLHVKFSGSVKTFSGRVEKILGGRGLRFFQEGLRIFHKGLGFFGKGLRLVRVFEIVSVMVNMLFLGRRSFSGRLRYFREGFKFFLRGGDAFGSV